MKIHSQLIAFIFLFVAFTTHAQEIIKNFSANTYSSEKINALKLEYGTNKIIPAVYETQILIALSYFPELKNETIEFRLKKAITPLSSKPTIFGLLQSAKKRKYIITISEETNSKLEPILFKNLNFNAQIGVLGHEISHVSNYITKGFGKMMNIAFIELLSKKQVDNFERNTDITCIKHGLGYQLLDWSKSVRQNLKMDNWRGADNASSISKTERYLNPESIINVMLEMSIYK